MLETASIPPSALDITNIFCDDWLTSVLSNASDVTDMLITGTGGVGITKGLAAPDNVIIIGLRDASLDTAMLADFKPADVGANVTVMTWLALGETTAVVCETMNSAASDPLTAMPVTDNAASPVFVMANVFVEVLPTTVESIVRDVGEMLIAGAGGGGAVLPTPLSVTAVGLPVALCVMDNAADLVPTDVGEKVTTNT